jgi:hypothetical protein
MWNIGLTPIHTLCIHRNIQTMYSKLRQVETTKGG